MSGIGIASACVAFLAALISNNPGSRTCLTENNTLSIHTYIHMVYIESDEIVSGWIEVVCHGDSIEHGHERRILNFPGASTAYHGTSLMKPELCMNP